MEKSWMFRTQLLAVVLGLLICGNAVGQTGENTAGATDTGKEAQADVQAELAAIKAELQAVRNDLKKVLAELRAVKAAQPKAPAKPQQRKVDTTIYNIDIGDSPIRGPKDAPVTIVEYVCFQCPYCARELPVIKQVMDAYPKDVRWVFKHFPLSFHKKAKPAHAAAALAHKQKGTEGFWQMHDLILGDYKKIDVADLRKHAETVGLDLAEFDAVMADPAQIDALLSKDLTEAKKYGVQGTPSVFINGLKLSPRGLDKYKTRIDAILQKEAKGKGAKEIKK